MKVLLVGEYSGLHNCLKQGLAAHGVDVTLASDGDAWKGFPSDVHFASPFRATSLAGRVTKNVKPFFVLPDPAQFDVVQLVNPLVLTPRLGINTWFVKRVAARARKLFLLAAGDDIFYLRTATQLRYDPIAPQREIDLAGRSTPWDLPALAELNEWLARRCDGVIPVAWEYGVGYAGLPAHKHLIPMPVDLSQFAFSPNEVRGRVVFLHGINRPGFKGTRHILEAFERSRRRWGNTAEFVTVDRLPIRQYLEAVRAANVVVDQALTYSYGMNALISMASGRVVMSGAEPEAIEHLEGRCPVVNIEPDAAQITSCIDRVMEERSRLAAMGQEARAFVEANHDHVLVARRFLEAWA